MTNFAIKNVNQALLDPYVSDLFELKFNGIVQAMQAIGKNDPSYFNKNDMSSFFNGMVFSSSIDFALYLKKEFPELEKDKDVTKKVYEKAVSHLKEFITTEANKKSA